MLGPCCTVLGCSVWGSAVLGLCGTGLSFSGPAALLRWQGLDKSHDMRAVCTCAFIADWQHLGSAVLC